MITFLSRISALLACVGLTLCMDYGGRGVWDSPMATDYWVKRFGFMWGGGSSGMSGLKALQVRCHMKYLKFEKGMVMAI